MTDPIHLIAENSDNRKRLDRFLQDRLAGHSRARLQEWIKGGRVLVNRDKAKPSQPLRVGDVVVVQPVEPRPLRAFPEDLPVRVLYEDSDVIAVDKPAGMVVHAGAGNYSGTLVNALLHRFSRLSGIGGEQRPGIVHRLDRDTSGVMLVARTDAAHQELATQFSSREVEKTYLALVHGAVRREHGCVDAAIARDLRRRTRMTAAKRGGRKALTEYLVRRKWEKFTLVELRLHTGRTHQIRVHMASIGHPVVGDRLYGAPKSALGRHFLHSHRIGFRSPSGGEWISIVSPLPADLAAWLEGL